MKVNFDIDLLRTLVAFADAGSFKGAAQLGGAGGRSESRIMPALMLSAGGIAGDLHSPGEWFEPVDAWIGPQAALMTVPGLVGVEGVSEPLLEERTR